MGIPFYVSNVDGVDLRYFWTGFQMLKLERQAEGGYREIDRVAIDPGFTDFEAVTPTRQVIVNGYLKGHLGEAYHLGFDIDSGDLVMSIATGLNPLFNGTFAGLKCDPEGNIWYTMMFGLVTLDTRKMAVVENPDPRQR